MSDVDKTISGLSDSELKATTAAEETASATNINRDLSKNCKTATLRFQQQQQHQQQHQHQHNRNNQHHHPRRVQQQSINFYCNSTSGSAIEADSTVAEPSTTATTTTTTAPGSPTPSCRNNCVSRILKLIFSTPGLVLLVVGYSVMGALIFPLLEAQQDITKSAVIAKSREDCLRELWIITEKLNVLYERNWTMLVHEQLRRFEGSIVAATRNGIATANSLKNGPGTAVGHFGGSLDAWDQARWSFSEALLYSVTVITTIGHGSLTPRTPAGKIATILYAIVGVPLMLMCLSSLGALLADALQCTYAKLCCRGHTAETNDSDDVKRCHEHCGNPDCQQDTDKGQELKCKNCKYDAIAVGAKLHHTYECNESSTASDGAIAHGKNEDSCRLLHNSPKAKINHNSSPGMPLKMTPQHAATIAQYYQYQKQQQQQQQQQQQSQEAFNRIQLQTAQPLPPPSPQLDVMVLATTTVTPTPTLTATSAAAAATTTMARSNADASPQHLPHGLQPASATFHIVSNATSPHLTSSVHSSPIHYNSNHQHPNNQHSSTPAPSLLSQQLAMRQYGNSMPQHFVAIPSSMVRFQVAPNSGNNSIQHSTFSNVGNSAVPPICYQPTASASASASASAAAASSTSTSTSVTVAGAATIYFPIAGAIGSIGAGASATATMPRPTTSIGGASSQLLCNQPLLKYHTIQLQHKKPPPPVFRDESATSGSGSSTTTARQEDDSELFDAANALPLPPPPAYQTATVHGVRRAKFIAKPLPPEINSLLAESDVTTTPYRHDLSAAQQLQQQQQQQNSATTTATMPPTIATNRNFEPTTICSNDSILQLLSTGCTTTTSMSSAAASMPGAHNLATLNGGESLVTLPTHATSTLPTNCTFNGSNVTVDIMEDEEEEQEQQGLGTCPHGTPSRMPLIPNTSNADDGKQGLLNATNAVSTERDYDKSARGLINATAASFHRHTLQTFHRGNGHGNGFGAGNSVLRNNRKSTLVTHQGGSTGSSNSGHTSSIWRRRSSIGNGCYGIDPNDDTSEDDDNRQATTSERYALEQFNGENISENIDDDANDGTDNDDLEQYGHNGPQVPISIVLLILVCYVSLGTVIFALWENWSLIDGAYFCFVTLATIGYGDFIPERTFQGPEVQLFACCAYLLLGLVLVAMAFSILETQLIWKCKRIAVRLRLTNN